MKNKISYFIVLLLSAMAVTFYACEDKDEYDYNAIEPILFNIAGPAATAAHGNPGFPATYSVAHRGGSTYQWVVGGHGGSFVQDETFPSIAYITFNESSITTTATVTVTETTMGGKVSQPISRTVNLTPFCPVDMNAWAGAWSSNNFLGANDFGSSPVTASVVTNKLNTLKINNFFDWVAKGFWGENWIPGSGGEGNAIIEFDCNNTIKIATQLLGTTFEWGPYWLWGSGTFNPTDKTMELNYFIGWNSTTAWNAFTAKLSTSTTKNGIEVTGFIEK